MPRARPIVFVTDFGLGNEWVGLCHSVMSGISPQSPIIDLSHLIRPLEVAAGALLLADSMPYVAEDAVILGVVEPNVGKDREIAIETASGRGLVGPDNGLLSLAWEAAGGIRAAVEITSGDVLRPIHAESFRAPDTLCPATAHLAAGMPIAQLGTAIDPAGLAVVELAEPEVEPGRITCEVIDFNRFGNVQLNVRPADLAAGARARRRGSDAAGRGRVGRGRREAGKHVRRLPRRRVRRAVRSARLADDRARQPRERARRARPFARRSRLAQPPERRLDD